MEYMDFSAMNTQVVLAGEGETARVTEGFAAARAVIEKREAQFSRFQETSELSAMNRSVGRWFNTSPEMFALVQQAYVLHCETQGLFDPAILPCLETAGYDASMDVVRARPSGARTLHRTALPADFRGLGFHETRCAVWLPAGMRVDLGGIAKGWIAEEAAHVLAEYCDACAVSAGGDMFAIGLPDGEMAWEIELEDPRNAAQTIAVLRLPRGALATSSITKRRWKQDAQERHHLIDPRTGLPAVTDWLSVSVIAPHAAIAEVFAKALLIAGSREAMQVASARDDIEFVAVDQDGKLWGSNKAGEFLHG